MRIAFLVGKFPVLSESFILNQITGLVDRGHEVDIYALDGRSKDALKAQPDVEKYCLLTRTHYMPKPPANYFKRVLKALLLLSGSYYKEPLVCLRLLNFPRHGKLSSSLSLLYKAIPLLGKGPYDIVHCQFAPL